MAFINIGRNERVEDLLRVFIRLKSGNIECDILALATSDSAWCYNLRFTH